MTPHQILTALGMMAEEIRAEHGVDADGKPTKNNAEKPVGKQLTAAQAEALWREEM